ncbi:MAG: hypothetical protein Q8N99_02135 [Nanoarchaeota archaeon]|nr:hypothetical protein [Nanoarchaeota archaeon]
MKRKLFGLASIVLLSITSGCASVSKSSRCIADSAPIDAIEQATLSALNDPEIIDFYKKYFPNGKLELSLYNNKKYSSKLYFNGKGNFKEDFKYEVFGGIEFRY